MNSNYMEAKTSVEWKGGSTDGRAYVARAVA